MCDSAAGKPVERSLSLILHSGRVSICLAQYILPHLDEGFGLGEQIDRAIRKILEEAECEIPSE